MGKNGHGSNVHNGAMVLLWLIIWFLAGHAALKLDPVNAWAATLILAFGLDLASSKRGIKRVRRRSKS
jgi:hypothetical protein